LLATKQQQIFGKEAIAAIRGILLNGWDHRSHGRPRMARHEYDGYTGELHSLIQRGEPVEHRPTSLLH
jgi:hypothetical protein